jgi:hypothetical protein
MHHGTSTSAGDTVSSHLLAILFIFLRCILPGPLRPVTRGDAYLRGWENGAAFAAGHTAPTNSLLWPASARRHYDRGFGHGHGATVDWLAGRTPEPARP